MNLRPSGYEPDELPGCSTPRQGVWQGFCRVFCAGVRWVLAFSGGGPPGKDVGATGAVVPGRDSPGCRGGRVGRAAGPQKETGRLRGFGGSARGPARAGHHEEKLSIVRFVDLAVTYSPAS